MQLARPLVDLRLEKRPPSNTNLLNARSMFGKRVRMFGYHAESYTVFSVHTRTHTPHPSHTETIIPGYLG